MSQLSSFKNTQLIKKEALRLGFVNCGIAKAEKLEEEAIHLEDWLNRKMNGTMGYMENYFDERVDPTRLVNGAKSIISLLYNYHSSKTQEDPTAPKIATFAYGTDYHFVVKDKLKSLIDSIHQNIGEVNGRVFVDSAPILEKAWAKRSGLGWIGKNSNLLVKKAGSYFFIAEVIVDLPLQADEPETDHCGKCTRCIEACPTGAIIEPYIIDARKCISYCTIELKGSIPVEMNGKMDNWAFGCDVCQNVCPWNRFASDHNDPLFEPTIDFLKMRKSAWQALKEDEFNRVFGKTALKRAKYHGVLRNIRALS